MQTAPSDWRIVVQLFEVQTELEVDGVGLSVAEIVAVGVGDPVSVGVSVAEIDAEMLGVGTMVAEIVADGVIDTGALIMGSDGDKVGDPSRSPPGGVVIIQKDPPLSYISSPILI